MIVNKHKLRTQKKYNDILRATLNIIAETPIEHITIQEIKHKARVSQVTIYKLFENKDNLILTAIKEQANQSMSMVIDILKTDLTPHEKMYRYFDTFFTIAIEFPRQRDIIEYIFSGINQDLKNYVLLLYEETYTHLRKLYIEARKESVIRKEISSEQFITMCDMYTRISPEFYQTKTQMDIVVKSIIKSFG